MKSIKSYASSLKKYNDANWCFFAFILGIINFFLILSYSQVAFGKYIFLGGDSLELYATVSKSIADSIMRGDTPFFFWSNYLGMNSSALIADYGEVFGITFWLSLIFHSASANAVIFLISMMLKVGLSCATFQIYSVKYLNSNKLLSLIMSLCYGLCAFQLSMNTTITTWMNALWLLPLIIYFIKEYLETANYIPLIICYAYLFITNFYMGFVVGIFSCIIFLLCIIETKSQYDYKKLLSAISKYALAVIIAAGISAFLVLPAGYFIFTHAATDLLPGASIQPNIADLINQLYIGANIGTEAVFPYIYCGLICLILLPGYFIDSNNSVTERILNALLLIFMIVSCLFRPLNLFWHAFNIPDGWGYRYAFVISFILCSIACKELANISSIKKKYYAITVPVLVLFYLLMMKLQNKYPADIQSNDIVYFAINCVFLVLITVCLCIYPKIKDIPKQHKNISALMILIFSLELIVNGYASIYHNENTLPETYTGNYYQWIQNTSDSIALIDSVEDSDFFRVDSVGDYTINSDGYFNYPGVSDFSSFENPNLRVTARNLGLYTSPRMILSVGNTDFTNMLTAVKYRINHAPYTLDSDTMETVNIVNPVDSYIGAGFLVDPQTTNFVFPGTDAFYNINALASAMTGENLALYEPFPYEEMNLTEEGISIVSNDEGQFLLADGEADRYGSKYLLINVPDTGRQACIRFSYGDFSYRLYDAPLIKAGSENLHTQNGILTIPYIKPMIWQNEQYTVALEMNDSTAQMFNMPAINIALYNKDVFEYAKAKLGAHTLTVSDYHNGYLHGNIEVSNDNSLLFTSVPYDKGWTVYVNGVEAPITPLVNNTFIGITLPAGHNDIVMQFKTPMLTTGVIITLISLLLLATLIVFNKKKH